VRHSDTILAVVQDALGDPRARVWYGISREGEITDSEATFEEYGIEEGARLVVSAHLTPPGVKCEGWNLGCLTITGTGTAIFKGAECEEYTVTDFVNQERPGEWNDSGFGHLYGFYTTLKWTLSRYNVYTCMPDSTITVARLGFPPNVMHGYTYELAVVYGTLPPQVIEWKEFIDELNSRPKSCTG